MPKVREINVLLDGVVKATAPDEFAARYEAQHLYSEARRSGLAPPVVTYKVRTVDGDKRDNNGNPKVTETLLGEKEDA